jgi:hypothetical protein
MDVGLNWVLSCDVGLLCVDAGLRHAALPAEETRELIHDVLVHYLISMSWRYDSIDSAREMVRRARRWWFSSQAGSLAAGLRLFARRQ